MNSHVEQKIASFDAATTPASIVLVLDASPSISRELGEMRTAAQSLSRSLQPEDEVAVVTFANETNLLLPFSRDRKLLAHKHEIEELASRVAEKGLTLVPLRLYFKDGRVKCEIALARGKEGIDKRRALADRDVRREIDRELKTRYRA